MGRSWSLADALDQVPVFTRPLAVWPAPNSTSKDSTGSARGGSMFRIATIALLIAMFMAASGSGGGPSSGSQSTSGSQSISTSVVVTPATATVYQGATTKFQ